MARKKNKNRRSAPEPSAQAFTDLEDEFFQSQPAVASSEASTGEDDGDDTSAHTVAAPEAIASSSSEPASVASSGMDEGDVARKSAAGGSSVGGVAESSDSVGGEAVERSGNEGRPEPTVSEETEGASGTDSNEEQVISSSSESPAPSSSGTASDSPRAEAVGALSDEWMNQGSSSLDDVEDESAYGGGYREDISLVGAAYDPYEGAWDVGSGELKTGGAGAADERKQAALEEKGANLAREDSDGDVGGAGDDSTGGEGGGERGHAEVSNERSSAAMADAVGAPEGAGGASPAGGDEQDGPASAASEQPSADDAEKARARRRQTGPDSIELNVAELAGELNAPDVDDESEEDDIDDEDASNDDFDEEEIETPSEVMIHSGLIGDAPGAVAVPGGGGDARDPSPNAVLDDASMIPGPEEIGRPDEKTDAARKTAPGMDYLPTAGEFEILAEDEEGGGQPDPYATPAEGDLPGGSDADLEEPALLDAGDPGDLPEPPVDESSLKLPEVDATAELGFDLKVGDETARDEIPPEAREAPQTVEADAPEPVGDVIPDHGRIWSIPSYDEGGVAEEVAAPAQELAAPAPSPSFTTGLRFEQTTETETGRPSDELTLEEQFERACTILADAADAAGEEDKESAAAFQLEIARLALSAGDETRARAALQKSLALQEAFHPALRLLTRLERDVEAWKEVIDCLETRALIAADDASRACCLLESAEIRWKKLGDLQAARRDFEEALDATTSHPAVQRRLEKLYIELGAWEDAAKTLEAYAEHLKPRPRAWIYHRLGELHASRMNAPEAAKVWYRRALELCPGQAATFSALERLLEQLGDTEGLEALYEDEARRVDNLDALQAWLRVVDLAARSGHVEKAVDAVRAAFALQPGNALLRREMRGWLARAEAWDAYEAALADEIDAESGDVAHLLRLALSTHRLRRGNNPDGALEALAPVLDAHPEWSAARRIERLIQVKKGNWKELAERAEVAAAAVAQGAERAFTLAQAAMIREAFLDDVDGALRAYRAAALADPSEPLWTWSLWRLLLQEERFDEMLAEDEALGAWPYASIEGGEDLEARALLARFHADDSAKALELARQALSAGRRTPLVLSIVLHSLSGPAHDRERVELLSGLAKICGGEIPQRIAEWEEIRRLWANPDTWGQALTAAKALAERTSCLPAALLIDELAWDLGDLEAFLRGPLDAHSDGDSDGEDGEGGGHRFDVPDAVLLALHGHLEPLKGLAEADRDVALTMLEGIFQERGDREGLRTLYARRLELPHDVAQTQYLQLRRAAWLEQDGECEDALVEVASAVAEGARDVSALNRLERLSLAQDQIAQLQELYRRLAEGADTPDPALALRMARNLEHRLNLPEAALAEYRRALWLLPDSLEAVEGTLRLAEKEKNPAAAAEALAVHLKHYGEGVDTAGVKLELGGRLVASENNSGAEEMLRALVHHPLLGERALEDLVRLYRNLGEVKGLESLYNEMIERAGDDITRRAWTMEMADELEALGALSEAFKHFEDLANSDHYLPAALRLERVALAEDSWKLYAIALEACANAFSDQASRDEWRRRAVEVRAERLKEPWAREQSLRKVLEEDPDCSEAADELRILLATQERWTDLTAFLKELAERTSNVQAEVRHKLDAAWVYANRLDDLDTAFECYQEVLDISEGEPEAIAALKEICEQRGDWSGLVAILARQSSTLSGEERIEAYREIARLWEDKLDEPSTAAESWRKVLELAPSDRIALKALTDLYRRLKEWGPFTETAIALLEARRTDDPKLLNEIGVAFVHRLDEPERAVPFLLRALARGEGDLRTLELIGDHFDATGQWPESAELFERLGEGAPEKADRVRYDLRAGDISFEKLRDPGRAARLYRKAFELAPEAIEIGLKLASALEASGRKDAAFEVLKGLVDSDRKEALEALPVELRISLFDRLAALLEERGEKTEALTFHVRAHALDSSQVPRLETIVRLHGELEDWRNYAQAMEELIERDPSAPIEARIARLEALGRAYRKCGEDDKALEAFSKVKDMAPQRISIYLEIAEIYRERGSWNILLSHYNSIIKHSTEVGEVVDAYLEKADILDRHLAEADPSYTLKAILHFEKALQYDKRNAYAMLRLAEIALRNRQFQKAAEWLKRVLAVDPTPEQMAQTHILGGILCAEAQRDPTTAMANFRKAAVNASKVEAWLDNLAASVEDAPGNLDVLLSIYRQIAPERHPRAARDVSAAS